jgi:hypothetical protein
VEAHLPEIRAISLVHCNHATHGVERVVASNKVVGIRQNAHVELPKVKMFRMREGGSEGKGCTLEARRPSQGEHVLVYFYVPHHVSDLLQSFPAPSSSSSFSFLGEIPALVSVLNFLTCWLCLAPLGFAPTG